ncbi:cobalt-precorrin-6A reductase [Streptomyces sp. G-G2]|uniref:cobalt-precorrin-6A reductase n=1 Tax=Streptomyces sp. G-G2 TaxID=3046201 RepID=UPI0024B94FF3|nr:cobalt-precorrin-6A reductase [Streptomyces sp. G-G2]MDJ0383698.1 cobalt-precorrin-6A reductase [Streptomyces sp. G-G2]
MPAEATPPARPALEDPPEATTAPATRTGTGTAAPPPTPRHVLILGGTTEARRLAEILVAHAPDLRVTNSLAGRVTRPTLPPGASRIGGFGGPEGLTAWLREHDVDAVVDATHPFAERISFNAARAAATTGIPLLALRRPTWDPAAGDDWHHVPTLAAAAGALAALGRRAFLTTGRTGLAAFAHLDATWFLVRSVDAPVAPMPRHSEILLARGPFTLPEERALIREHRIDVLVTKASGGSATAPKLAAAREAGIPVLVVDRPPVPEGVPVAASPEAAAAWLRERGQAP